MWKDRKLLLIGAIVLAMALAEGAANDWLPLLMVDGHGLDAATGSLVYVGFAAAMTLGRFSGRFFLGRFGRAAVVRASAVSGAVGLLLVIFSDNAVVAATAVLFWGLGASLGFPVALSAAGDSAPTRRPRLAGRHHRLRRLPRGPPALGFLGDHYGLRSAMVAVLVFVASAILIAPAADTRDRTAAAVDVAQRTRPSTHPAGQHRTTPRRPLMSPQEASGMIGVLLPRDIPQADVIAFAREADACGFGELWVVEDLGYRGGLVQAATVLARTRRIRVGVGLLPAAARNVAFAAMEAATLAQLHPGRLDIAVGHGMPDWMRSVGSWPASPLTLLGEYIHTLKTLLAGRSADTDGRYIRLDGLRLDPSVLPEHVPDIFAGVRGPKSLALSGEVADGTLLAEPVSPEYVRQALTSINSQRPHRLAAYNITVVDDDPHAALAAARPALQPLGDPDWAPHIVPSASMTSSPRCAAPARACRSSLRRYPRSGRTGWP